MARTPTRPFHGERTNAYLSWTAVLVAALVGLRGLTIGQIHDVVFAASVVLVALIPVLVLESRRAALPWEIPMLAVLPLIVAGLAPDPFSRQVALYVGAAPIALALTLELNAFTEIRLERWLAVSFVTMLSAALAAVWATTAWSRDLVTGTAVIPSNEHVMWLLIASTGAGLLAGIVFDRYYRQFPGEELVSAPVDGIDEELFAAKTDADDHPNLEERLPIAARRQRQLVWAMRGGLVAILVYGFVTFEFDAIGNVTGMLAITFLPTLLRRRYDLPFDAGLTLWVTLAVFLHAVGSFRLYELTFWWHNLTHPLTATLVGAIGYVVIRVLDERRDDIHLPPRLVPAFVVLFVVAFGVFWEIGEFGFDVIAAHTGLTMPLAQHGLDDTMTDLVFNTIGAIVVATWGLPYLTDLTQAVSDRLEGWSLLEHESTDERESSGERSSADDRGSFDDRETPGDSETSGDSD